MDSIKERFELSIYSAKLTPSISRNFLELFVFIEFPQNDNK